MITKTEIADLVYDLNSPINEDVLVLFAERIWQRGFDAGRDSIADKALKTKLEVIECCKDFQRNL
jgi:hypothetical protein